VRPWKGEVGKVLGILMEFWAPGSGNPLQESAWKENSPRKKALLRGKRNLVKGNNRQTFFEKKCSRKDFWGEFLPHEGAL